VASTGANTLVVHFVPEQAEELALLFGGETGDEVDKFARCEWRPGPDGDPSWPTSRTGSPAVCSTAALR
jgi:flavin reductase (DIM6/NTAB) family NADH-FMN oxidoreductase RutF